MRGYPARSAGRRPGGGLRRCRLRSRELLAPLEDAGIHAGFKVQQPPAPNGHFPRDRFGIDLRAGTVTCPAGITAPTRARGGRHARSASFGAACRSCPLAAQCTTAP